MRVLTVLLALAGTAACTAALADQTPAPAGAAVYIIKPAAGGPHTHAVRTQRRLEQHHDHGDQVTARCA